MGGVEQGLTSGLVGGFKPEGNRSKGLVVDMLAMRFGMDAPAISGETEAFPVRGSTRRSSGTVLAVE